ncbi:protein lin-52 homolog isoform X5 [Topomyia yanbarensis]|uniref:protein lin-52 homolog isoform X5 n=1 Tax=Topomyia yanbarensis TaxID=2498891 RepID=UPI00273C2FF6|nr:protein lin-52 homolog isoform X5 [Topomyia yanbarensis]
MVDSDGKTSPVKIKEELDGEPNLMSLEKVDRDSSEIWPEKEVHGFDTPNLNFSPPPWTKGLTQDDINSMYQLGALSTNGIIAEVKKLYDQSYQLGVQEAKEMTRGKYLNIFTSSRKKI